MRTKVVFILIISLLSASIKAQDIQAMAASSVKRVSASNSTLSTPTNIPEDTADVYESLLNTQQDDLMESHPADDIYNDIWSSASINPYKIPASKLPKTFTVDCSNFTMPLDMSKARISSNYGRRWSRFHHGIDIAIPSWNNIYAAFDGEVRIVKYQRRGYGHYIVIRHDNGLETVYAHLNEPLCKVNDKVKSGQIIGKSGNTGRSTGPHLHFEVRFIGNSFNPTKLINFRTQKVHAQRYTLRKGKEYNNLAAKKYKARKRRARYHKVRRGECLGKIAQRYRTSVKRIKRLNRMRNSKIKIGQRLRVR